MVQYYPELDRAFAALADSTRRRILQRLGQSSATVTELAEPFGMTLTGLKKHLRVLEEVGLVSTEKVGRARVCNLGPRRLDDVQQWIEAYRGMSGGAPRPPRRAAQAPQMKRQGAAGHKGRAGGPQ